MIKRTRSGSNKTKLDNTIDKQRQKNACTVCTALANCNYSYISIMEDTLPDAAGSQDILNACMTQALLEQDK